MKKLIVSAVVAAAALGAVPAVAGASGNAYGKAGQACAESYGYSSLGAVFRAGVDAHGNVAGGVRAGLDAHCSG
jgi:hypothetical protein